MTGDADESTSPMHRRAHLRSIVAVGLAGLTVGCGGGSEPIEDPVVAAWVDRATAGTQDTVDEAADDVVAALPDGTRAIAHVTTTRCVEGQHNWKIDDPFDLRCTVTSGTLLAVTDAEAFIRDMASVDRAVQAAGWQPSSGTLPDQLRTYADGFGERDEPGRDGTTAPYGPQHLPSVSYHDPDRPEGLGFVFTGPDERSPDVLLFPGDTLRWERPGGPRVRPDDLPELLTGAEYGLLVVSSRSRSDPGRREVGADHW